ncbi:PPOX class F420-dependent oxidoreductase [Mycobacterium branderi]|uniref:PPOX class F420-dependent enzyme n=1 Tax=Mycobacterium branderi TaxID=43348 RepID=A0A7I7VXF8_9MYCO|nr:PPOX class F420-dependent oxidoreductase [Mycobacterium branderi]MCV7232929.1 PPOX class F420-dependent oxidoreductase [Mycobacterium branderi]ORA41719.1 PPOX class F420-dependent enzyme [Mycobacterium branderi]BBZ10034.1 PPOX class F420-dependent enzyme [Mycobacterium branderi]
MTTIPESHRDLFEAPLVASLSTVGSDGTPQVTAIWFVADGDTVKASLVTARQKYKNVVAHPRATLFIIDPNNPFRTLEIRGTVQVDEDPELKLFERVFRHYGQDPATFPAPRDGRVAITLLPTHVVAQG